jgi:phosphatidate phosphatase
MDIFKQEARLSFFSGHSSVALTSATFFWFYTQDRLAGQLSSQVVVPILQTLKLSSALLIAYTRILDNWHHWSDVVVGCLVGIFVTTLLVSLIGNIGH